MKASPSAPVLLALAALLASAAAVTPISDWSDGL